jgi:DHA1 family bicyclomycin/chloramphenicol resistance-like MFS transporter
MVRRFGESRMMVFGQAATLGGLVLMLALSQTRFDSALGFVLPLILLGVGHGFLMPPSLAGSVGVLAGLAGAAAAVAGLMQQLTGAVAGYAVGLLPNQRSLALGLLMVGFTLCALAAQFMLRQQRRGASSAGVP